MKKTKRKIPLNVAQSMHINVLIIINEDLPALKFWIFFPDGSLPSYPFENEIT
jgi:hypothetical protein